MNGVSQNARLLSYLEHRGPITQLTAYVELGICRLSERVRELERLGYSIEHKTIRVPSRHARHEIAHVTLYRLIQEKTA